MINAYYKIRIMYKDIISYELAHGISQEHLLSIAKDIVSKWMSNLEGFKGWEIHSLPDGSYVDIVYWDKEQDAKNAEAQMVNIPNASDWYGCYKEGSIKSKHLHLAARLG